ncbi:hypothetical protein BMS_0766 [Halobacteriovorax marinus SJ]|uniref:Uncharacterized protein n=1 Tax=Halobacteriovorax marinus (strain ATCC BAA-682 / DSM 15412 / SJ) TaxID=862908 RepID=E1X5V3_HALMS|nr:hypothetical protein [Halobacteriovorax marinus]CBW25670.1 hypothetical protein BMS_0766 [Halobacteriovorax marinus SJ]
MEGKQPCFFTNEDAEVDMLSSYDGHIFRSQGCGRYWLDNHSALMSTGNSELSSQTKLNCASETVKLNEMGLTPYWIWSEQEAGNVETFNEKNVVIKYFEDYTDIPNDYSSKSNEILLLLAKKLEKRAPFDFVPFTLRDMYGLKISSKQEFVIWLKPLLEWSYVRLTGQGEAFLKQEHKEFEKQFADALFTSPQVSLTPSGWQAVEKETSQNPNTAFIAMAFTDNEKKELGPETRNSIKEACEGLGWDTKIVDEEEHNDGIMDKVVSLINKSKFLIAELTHQKTGVYYEAGYAKGRGLPVIHIVNKEDLKNCHFDVKHLNLVTWSNHEELKERLSNRIEATIGKNK